MTERSSPITRRALLAGAALLPVAPARGAAPVPITVVSANTLTLSSLDLINAGVGGHFRAAGLDAQIVAASTGIAAMQQLVAGRCQFTRGHGLDVFKAVARQKAPIIAIAGLEHEASYLVVSAAANPVPTAEALAGKRIGILGVGSTTDVFLDLLLARAGIDRNAVERQVVPIGPAAFVPVQQGRLDAVLLPKEIAASLSAAGEKTLTWSISRYISVPGRSYITTSEMIEKSPDIVLSFLRAMAASVREIIAGPTEPLIVRAVSQFGTPSSDSLSLSREVVAEDVASWLADGSDQLLRNMPGAWAAARKQLAAAQIAVVEDETRLYTNSLIDRALAQ